MAIALFRSFRKPNGCLDIIGGNTLSLHEKNAEPILCVWVALLRCLRQPGSVNSWR